MRLARIALLFAPAVLAGCFGAPVSPGARMMVQDGPVRALDELQREAQERPSSAPAQRHLGFALAAAGRNEEALERFQRARGLDGGRPETIFALAQSAEALGRFDVAAEAYAAYLRRSQRGASVVKSRLREVVKNITRAEIDSALASEERLPTRIEADSSVCVPDFRNVSSAVRWVGLSRGLAAFTGADLSKIHGVRVLERFRLQVLREELAQSGRGSSTSAVTSSLAPVSTTLGVKQRLQRLVSRRSRRPYYSGSLDSEPDPEYLTAVRQFQGEMGLGVDGRVGPKTQVALERALAGQAVAEPGAAQGFGELGAPRLGRLLKARDVVQGAFVVAEDAIRLDALIWDGGKDSTVPVAADVSGRIPEVLRLQKELVLAIVAAMGIQLTAEEQALVGKPATSSFEAFLAYCEGLEYEDQGDFDRALRSFERALTLDPRFADARDQADLVSATPEQASALGQAWQSESLEGESGDPAQLGERLGTTAVELGFAGDVGSENGGASRDVTITGARKLEPSSAVTVTLTGELPAPPSGARP